jgi:hypothetical protein
LRREIYLLSFAIYQNPTGSRLAQLVFTSSVMAFEEREPDALIKRIKRMKWIERENTPGNFIRTRSAFVSPQAHPKMDFYPAA